MVTPKHIKEFFHKQRLSMDWAHLKLDALTKQNEELLFANYFRDSIASSPWVKDKSFSAFQAAANYSFLYKLFKIYDILRPQNTLEFGLGQTTKLTTQYLAANSSAKAAVIDGDNDWIEIYKRQVSLPKNINISCLDLESARIDGQLVKDTQYKGLAKITGSKKYDFIIVDGPIGYDKEFARTNILSLLDNLSSSWVVVFDDAERAGEQNTIKEFEKRLNAKKIAYKTFTVSAIKSQTYFCCPELYKTLYNI